MFAFLFATDHISNQMLILIGNKFTFPESSVRVIDKQFPCFHLDP